MLPNSDHYWLKNAHVSVGLLVDPGDIVLGSQQNGDGMSLVDLEIKAGKINSIRGAGTTQTGTIPTVDLQKQQIWPCFVDVHTHLDKGHIWERSPNPDGTFEQALVTAIKDEETWTAEDLYRRMEFGLKCSYAQGTKAIRTHLDSAGRLTDLSWDIFKILKKEWSDRISLQAVSLVGLDYFLTPEGERLADLVAESGEILGGVAYLNPDLEQQIERVFKIAQDRKINLDFHVDETGDPVSNCLHKIAEAALKHQFSGQIVCGHCCSLAVQSEAVFNSTIKLVKEAGIGIVSLPMCNLYLQDRQYHQPQIPRTPRWRGPTLVHELKQAEVPVAFASDNCRDPFYGFGDHDGLEVFKMAVRICHLDRPYQDWLSTVTKTPADLMGLSQVGRLGVGYPADFIILKGRYLSEVLSRSQLQRIVVRNGQPIDMTLPDYSELDDLIFGDN